MSIDKPEVGDINWDGSLNAALDELDARETVAGAQSKATAAYIAAVEYAEQRISDVELEPGAKGDPGDPGPPGNDGGQGPAGIVDDHTLADRITNGDETATALIARIATFWTPVDNGDGTLTIPTGLAVDNLDGTLTIGA